MGQGGAHPKPVILRSPDLIGTTNPPRRVRSLQWNPSADGLAVQTN